MPVRIPRRLPSTSFASFFFHNAHWAPTTPRFTTDSAYAPQPPSASLASFRTIDAPSPTKLVKIYGQLAKSRLTTLVVLTAMSGIQEVPFDAQMTRTRTRPLVRRAITPMHATGFAIATGIAGPALLWTMVGPTTACLGAANIALYAGLYTWMKRRSIYNTWVGAVVGALPPLMGWTACGGQLFPSASYPVHYFLPSFLTTGAPVDLALVDNPLAPLAFFMLLFSWQFPHFNSLSYIVRDSYAQAGYRMLSVLSPPKNALVSLRHATLLVPVCSILFPLSGLTTWMFALTSLPLNLICVRAAWRFWRTGGEKEARVVFQHSLWYLPVVMGLMMFHKQGMEWLECSRFRRRLSSFVFSSRTRVSASSCARSSSSSRSMMSSRSSSSRFRRISSSVSLGGSGSAASGSVGGKPAISAEAGTGSAATVARAYISVGSEVLLMRSSRWKRSYSRSTTVVLVLVLGGAAGGASASSPSSSSSEAGESKDAGARDGSEKKSCGNPFGCASTFLFFSAGVSETPAAALRLPAMSAFGSRATLSSSSPSSSSSSCACACCACSSRCRLSSSRIRTTFVRCSLLPRWPSHAEACLTTAPQTVHFSCPAVV
ncbi:UbiA prenyltransferase family-domain-containing protein [Pholiota molesta]|nr:UbiA prenyltransferase family-domain-containing protein [Pholiota molesta]